MIITNSLSLFAIYLATWSGVYSIYDNCSYIADFGESNPIVEPDKSLILNLFSVILAIISSLLALFLKKNNLFFG